MPTINHSEGQRGVYHHRAVRVTCSAICRSGYAMPGAAAILERLGTYLVWHVGYGNFFA